MAKAQVQLDTSLAFAASARPVLVGKPDPAKIDPKRTVELADFGHRGLVRASAGIAIGERVFERDVTALRLPVGEPKIVAGIDPETRARFGELLITWVGASRPRTDDLTPKVVLDPERFAYVLLDWAYQQAMSGSPTADLAAFAADDVPLDSAKTLGRDLQAAGLMSMSTSAGPALISLTATGIAEAEQAAAERGDRRRRAEELRNGIVRWLWDWDDADTSADFRDFVWDHRCTFRGHFFNLNEVSREAQYLMENKLICERNPWWLAPRLTAAGRDCAAYKGGNVQEHLNPNPAGGPTVNFHGTNSGNVAIGHDVTQTANTGTTPPDNTQAAAAAPAATANRKTTAQARKNTGLWAKARTLATGMSGVITLVATVVVAVFTVLIWIIMSK